MHASDGPPQAATPEEMAALEAFKKEGTWEVGGHAIPLTNLEKVLFPGANGRGRTPSAT